MQTSLRCQVCARHPYRLLAFRIKALPLSGIIKSAYINTFVLQKLPFHGYTTGKAGKIAVCSHNSVTGDNDRDRIVPCRAANSLSRHDTNASLLGDSFGKLAVRHHFPIGNICQHFPHCLTERTAAGSQWQFRDLGPFTVKISVQPVFRFSKYRQRIMDQQFSRRRSIKRLPALCPQADQAFAVASQRECPHRRCRRCDIVCHNVCLFFSHAQRTWLPFSSFVTMS